MKYDHVLINYYSGTGNSYRVACWLDQAARDSSAATTLNDISHPPRNSAEDDPDGKTLEAFFFPAHGFTAPWPVIRFALRLPRRPGRHALVCATRGGSFLGSKLIPGMEGTAAWLVACILRLKGYRIYGIKGINMPTNWTAIHSGYDEQTSQRIIARSQPTALDFFQGVLGGQQRLQGWLPLSIGLLLLPLSLGYLLLGRFFLSKLLYASHHCIGCGLCAKHCPSQAIRMTGKAQDRPFWTFSCHSCMRCMNLCPVQAIEANYVLIALLVWLGTLPYGALLLGWLGRLVGMTTLASSMTARLVVQIAGLLWITWALYALFHLLLGIPWFNRLITTLSLTHYYKRYKEPDTNLNNL